MQCPVVSLGVSMGLIWCCATCFLMFRVEFLFFWRMSVCCLVLELVGPLVELGLSVDGGFGVGFSL